MTTTSNFVVVTRHKALIQHLTETGVIPEGAEVIEHATVQNVTGKKVVGVLPLYLSSLTESLTEVPMNLPPELRGKELGIEEVRKYAGQPVTYQIRKV